MKRLLSVIAAIAVMMSLVSFASAETPTKKTQLWWMINAARGNGAFSLEFELARTPAQIESGAAHGQRGILEGKDGVIRVYNRNADGTFTEATNSAVMTMFGTNLRLLTQMNHNHNNERTTGDPTSRPFPAPHPEWLGLTDNGVGFGNGGYELFPRISHNALTSAANPFEMNIVPVDPDRGDALLFVYDGGAMAAAHYNGTWIKVSNLKPELSGVTPATLSTKTQLWWIINAARGNGEFRFEFSFEDGTQGIVRGRNGNVTVYTRGADGEYKVTPDSPAMTAFAQHFRLLTQQNHNHNNERTSGDPTSRPFPAPHPEWLGLTDNGVGFGNGGYELFPRIAPASLTSALNPFEMNIPPVQTVVDAPEAALLFVYDGGVMAAAHYDGVWMRITNLQNSAGVSPIPEANPETGTPSAIPAIITVAGLGAAVVIAGVLSKKKRRIK
jgi:lipocalin